MSVSGVRLAFISLGGSRSMQMLTAYYCTHTHTCSFSRSIAAMDAGQDLNLNGDYFVMYGTNGGPACKLQPVEPSRRTA